MSTAPRTVPPPGPFPPKLRAPRRPLRWDQRLLVICLSIFSLVIGLFLVVFPWLTSWDQNWVALYSPALRSVWLSPYFRGALSGLGLINLYIGAVEFLRQLKALFSRSVSSSEIGNAP
jgi:hypothetical protein